LNIGGIIVFDDASYAGIRKVCRYVLTNLRYRVLGPLAKKASRRRRMIQRIVSAEPLSWLAKPEYITLDEMLALSRDHNYVALQKETEDLIGVGQNVTRRWDTHNPF